nr:hypothetical protein [Tanacetum cinerariifolium]
MEQEASGVDAAVKILKDIMRVSKDKAQVLYVPDKIVGGEDRLLHVCEFITDDFIKGSLVFEKDCQRAIMNLEQVLYHMEFEEDPALVDLNGVVELTGPADPKTIWLSALR